MKFLIALLAICMCAVLVSGQFFGAYDRRFALSPNDLFSNSAPVRDPRQDRGPVVFPPPPPDSPVESSGVIIGGSGFGFVPPSQSRTFGAPSRSSFDYYNRRFFRYF